MGGIYGMLHTASARVAADDRAAAAAARVGPKLKRELAAKGLRMGDPVFIRIFKESRELEMWIQEPKKKIYKLFKTYPVANWGGGTLGPKLKQGDGQAPEGFYFVQRGQMNPKSKYHLAFNLGYPNGFDLAHRRTGDFLMVHGSNVSIGCYAMTDALIEEIYTLTDAALRKGQGFFRVHAFPFRMTEARMKKAADSRWFDFWKNLKTGYDWFENSKLPPNVTVDASKRYRFGKAGK
jgi:murein L,D-transpeptidase YafK